MNTEAHFRQVLDQLLEGIQIHDFEWRYVYVNDSLVSYSGFTREELLGYTITEKYPGMAQSPLFETMDRCMKERISEKLQTEFAFPDGTIKFFELSIQPVDEGICILSIDLTEQKKAEEKLLESNRLYALLSSINQMHCA